MSQQSWTIGSAPSCDLVVQSPAVSAQHCRLRHEDTQTLLTDLGSTNGTFVNGQRLSGSKAVSTDDRITLGHDQPMPWPDALKPERVDQSQHQPTSVTTDKSKQIITVGRASDNTVVLHEANVSSYHARMSIKGGEITIEDLGSTNGTAVGSGENKISRTTISSHDFIFFGSTSYRADDLLQRAEETASSIDPQRASQQDSDQRTGERGWISQQAGRKRTAIVVVAAGLGLLLVAWSWRDRDSSDAVRQTAFSRSQPAASAATSGSETALAETSEDQVAGPSDAIPATPADVDSPAAEQVTLPQEITASAKSLTAQEKLARSLFVFVCADPQRDLPFRIGTGFAVDKIHVVTSAAVIQAMDDLGENGYSNVFLHSPATGDDWQIVSTRMHPEFKKFNMAAREAKEEHDAMFAKLKSEPPKPDKFEAVKEQLLSMRGKALEAIAKQISYDVAVVELDQTVSHWLEIANPGRPLRPNQKVKVAGYAFDVEDPYFDPAVSSGPATFDGRHRKLIKPVPNSAARMVASSTDKQDEFAYLGSPVMNTGQQVIGIYSRPTPPKETASAGQVLQSDSDPTFDAALSSRLSELLP